MADQAHHQKIAALNDAFRRTFAGGRVMLTAGIDALPALRKPEIMMAVQAFNKFNTDNDPYHEHDFGTFELHGRKIFWKIDYYDKTMEAGSEDPADPEKTTRVLTIMLAEEY